MAAINGGGFYDPNGTGTGRLPYGFILHKGKYLLGQQVDDSEKVDFVGMTKSGNLIAGNYNKKQLRDMGAIEGLTFGPPLIINGQKVIKAATAAGAFHPVLPSARRKTAPSSFSLSTDGSRDTASVLPWWIPRIFCMKMVLILQPTWTEAPPPPCTITAR